MTCLMGLLGNPSNLKVDTRALGLPSDREPWPCHKGTSMVPDAWPTSKFVLSTLEDLSFSLCTDACYDNQLCIYFSYSSTISLLSHKTRYITRHQSRN